MLRDALLNLAPRLGLEVDTLATGAWLVQDPARSRPLLRPQRLGRRLWAVRDGRRPLAVRRIGGPRTRTRVLFERGAAREYVHKIQREMGQYLLEQQLAALLEDLRVDCVLDVGANRGQFARRLRKMGFTGRIVSFEPLPEFTAVLRKRAAADHDWIVREWALGDEEGTAEIFVTPGRNLSSLLPPSDFGRQWSPHLREAGTAQIEVRRLDSVLDEVLDGLDERRVFLKLDTQGYDLPAVRGAGDRLADILGMQSEVACVPLYESMPEMEEQLAEYRRLGFDIAGMYPVGRHKRTHRVIEFDVVMVRASAFDLGHRPGKPASSS